MSRTILILGCGYTGRRVAARLAERGEIRVIATTRDASMLDVPGVEVVRLDVEEPATLGALARAVPGGLTVLHSVPLLSDARDPTPLLLEAVGQKAVRVIYLSTTGVYGATEVVDESTPAAPLSARELARRAAEDAVLGGAWSSLVLRPAAIYGPWRGVHAALRKGRFKLWRDGSNWVSRIHVEDLAALAEAALLSDLSGTYPVADEEPCRSREIVEFCCELLDLPVPGPAAEGELDETRRANRRVDGRAVCRTLNVKLRYPSYRIGVPDCLRLESIETPPAAPNRSRDHRSRS
jgi:nucleoside-diphosphate-sugar epimerase